MIGMLSNPLSVNGRTRTEGTCSVESRKLDVDHFNQTGEIRKPFKPDEIKTGPRGGKYRINSNGRKSYDVP